MRIGHMLRASRVLRASAGAALLAAALSGRGAAQDARRAEGGAQWWLATRHYQLITTYDRLTDSTRVTAVLRQPSSAFGLGSRGWLDVSFTHPGRALRTRPEFVVFALESFTPARGGWAFARPRDLTVEAPAAPTLRVPAAQYVKRRVRLFDSGRRESISFRVPVREFLALAAMPKVTLRVGDWKLRLEGERLEMLREVARRLAPVSHPAR